MRKTCNNEQCWLKHKCYKHDIDERILNNDFAPETPSSWHKNPNEWLNSLDITNVMQQYENSHSNFDFIGPSPVDFDEHFLWGECVWDELCKFNLKKHMDNGKTKIGIIFNLDPHTKDGSHWVSMFVDIEKKLIVYFDSYGDKPPKRIFKLVKRIEKQGSQEGIHFDYHYIKNRHQYGNSECGMFSLYFIIQLLTGKKTYRDFLHKKYSDRWMQRHRKIYFNM